MNDDWPVRTHKCAKINDGWAELSWHKALVIICFIKFMDVIPKVTAPYFLHLKRF